MRAGMKPLRFLSAQIAARDPTDVSPVRSAGSYSELIPLERALNQQFSSAADRIRRDVNAGQKPPLFAGEVAVLMHGRFSRTVPAGLA